MAAGYIYFLALFELLRIDIKGKGQFPSALKQHNSDSWRRLSLYTQMVETR